MSRHSCPESGAPLIPDELDLHLLHKVQATLRRRHSGPARSGSEEDAFGQFYDLYNPLLERFAVACSLKGEDAEDCLQEAWRQIIESLPEFTSDGTQSKLCSWLHSVVRSKALNMHRRQSRHRTKALSPQMEASLASPDYSSSPFPLARIIHQGGFALDLV
jgi:RNA polymerase sigma-70 factor (ECF subfamily)